MKRIGFSSHCFSRSLSICEIIEFGRTHRFNAMELNVDETTFNPEIMTDTAKKMIREISESGEVRFSIHGPEDVNFSDSTDEGRREAIRRVEAALRLAAELKIATVVVHPGKVAVDFGNGGIVGVGAQTIAGIKRCTETARSLGVTVSVENLCHEKGTVAPNIKRFLEMCEQVGLSKIGVTLDTGHSFVDGLENTVSVIGEYVDHIHIDDNSGQRSEHLELGRGNIDFQAIAEYLRRFEGIINIELKRTKNDNTKEEDGAPILRSRDYILRLLDGVPVI